jgi:hypothetical protein
MRATLPSIVILPMARLRRSTAGLLVAALAAIAVLPAAASGQNGNGLYEPFPEAAIQERAQRFVERLPLPEAARLSDEQLERGVYVDPRLAPSSQGPASARAGVGNDGGSDLSPVTQVALLLLAVVALSVLAGRRLKRHVAAGST